MIVICINLYFVLLFFCPVFFVYLCAPVRAVYPDLFLFCSLSIKGPVLNVDRYGFMGG